MQNPSNRKTLLENDYFNHKILTVFRHKLEGVAKSQSRLSGVIVKTGDQLGKIIWGPCLFWVTTIQSGAFGLNLVFNVATRFK